MEKLIELQPNIIEWAKERNIHLTECASSQRLKLIEECGELARAILKNDIKEQKDAIGDIFVVSIILAEQTKIQICFEYDDFLDESSLDFFILFELILTKNRFYFILGHLNDICKKLNLDITECANIAWNEIKDRKGTTINGTFIKNE